MESLNIQQLGRLSIVLLSFICIYFIVFFMWHFLFPFIVAITFSWLIQPLIRILHTTFKVPKSVAVITILIISVGSLVTFFAAAVTKVITFIQDLSNQDFSGYVHTINVFHNQFINWIDFALTYVKDWIGTFNPSFNSSLYSYLEEIKQRLVQFGIEQLHAILQMVSGLLTNLPSMLIAGGFILISTFFISKDWDQIQSIFHDYFSSRLRSPIKTIATNFKATLKQLLKAQLILMTITMVIVFIGMLIVKHPHPFLITLLAGIIDFIPYIGTGVIFLPWIAYAFFTDQFGMTIQLSCIYMTVVVCRQLFEPKVLASHFGIHPLLLLMGLFIGFQIWGGVAIIITPIIIAFFKAMHSSGVPSQLWEYILGK
ncbi:sporulation integral membrane protein YtvI [Halobacillus andaensis]|uniref:sporulation integral membrane protein YtvI n=1 Tax=Halobacillus andaensis TaxID=1176239 RepID=UPI003D73A25E